VLTHGRCLSSHLHAEFRIFQWLPIQHDRLDLGTAGSSVWYAPLSHTQDRSGCHQSAMSFVLNKIDSSGSTIACLPFNGKPPPGRRARRWPRLFSNACTTHPSTPTKQTDRQTDRQTDTHTRRTGERADKALACETSKRSKGKQVQATEQSARLHTLFRQCGARTHANTQPGDVLAARRVLLGRELSQHTKRLKRP
jgi:hypothetical protein